MMIESPVRFWFFLFLALIVLLAQIGIIVSTRRTVRQRGLTSQNRPIEWLWTVAPLFILLGLLYLAWQAL